MSKKLLFGLAPAGEKGIFTVADDYFVVPTAPPRISVADTERVTTYAIVITRIGDATAPHSGE